MKEFIFENNDENTIKKKIKVLFEYNNDQEANCKNIIYKGKILLLKELILDQVMKANYNKLWPHYIKRHLFYVDHLESKIKLNK